MTITVTLIGIAAISWGFTIYGLVDYWLITGPKEEAAMTELVNVALDAEMLAARRPEQLQIESVAVLGGAGKYDLAVKIINPNPNWYLAFDYKFAAGGKDLPAGRGFILPGEEKYLVNLGAEFPERPADAAVIFERVKWQRISAHEIPDYQAFAAAHLKLDVLDKNFESLADKLTFNQLDFKIKNNTAYSYWNVDAPILLFRGSNLVGANFVSLSRFLSGETRAVSLQWKDSGAEPSEIKILPSVNIFDPAVYMPPR